jgi:hypothetical protein
MADQNQNTIPGTLRTLKTDLDSNNTNPQDRLQQAGNFVQARPNLDSPIISSDNTSNKAALSTLDINDSKQDIPESKPVTPQAPSYSWSNINTSASTPIDIKKDISTPNSSVAKSELKSGFSALDETIDFPLNNLADPNSNISNTPNTPGTPQLSNIPDFTGQQDDNTTNTSKSSSKAMITGFIVVILLGLIGAGIYFYISRSTPETPTQTNNTPKPNTPENITPPTVAIKPLFMGITKSDISFNDTEPIRKTVATSLNAQKAPFVELNLTKDGKKVSLADISIAFGLTIPKTITDNVTEYWLYGYNQEGIYKLTATIQLNAGQTAKTLVDNWSTAIPRDLSGFSLSSSSRIVNKPEIKTSTVTNSLGKTFTNYYYNYTSSTDSTDVSSVENYIVIASSQNSMNYLLNQIK